ncbi:DUF3307 domain-containing protein [Nonlabens xiamenensis]|uniref:DUF3307 domain-containing protein n=1 Tax=Nonlabens xiamenensis TaxID=2341043 RepID=UPI000F615272|nr:DUF3307 domain-containing protein [Nonlabens xiamenensis]
MHILARLLIAHLLGDFVFQNDWFAKKKSQYQLRSYHLYLHAVIHAGLSWILLWEWKYWYVFPIIGVSHLAIDAGKLYLSGKWNKRWLFALDQLAHLLVLIGLYLAMTNKEFLWWEGFELIAWPLICCILFLTTPVAIMLKVFFTRWTLTEEDTGIYGLKNAGKWIGIIERLLIFLFIITDHFSAVGLLLTAKSVFRFGDLSKAKNMKLTEYVLIGTLLSFGIAILVGLLFKGLYL